MVEIIDEPGLRNRVHVFEDRFHAGELLAEKLIEYESRENACVLAIPAGGVQVGYIVSERLGLPLDVAVTRKIHIPWNREAGFGAVSWDGTILLNESLVSALGLTREEIDRCVAEEQEVIRRRLNMLRGDNSLPDLKGKIVIVVDDGLASGFSMLATVRSILRMGIEETVVAVPTASESAIRLIRPHADKIVCLNIRSGPWFAVADAYRAWYDLEEEYVVDILEKSNFFMKLSRS